MIELFLEAYHSNMFLHHAEKDQNLAMSMAKQKSSSFKPMEANCEIVDFLRQLFDCQVSNVSPSGKPIIRQIDAVEMESWF